MASATASEQPLPLQHHRFTVDQYHNMIQTGVFHEDDRVELIHGEIVDMTPIGKDHSSVVDQLNRHFNRIPNNTPLVRIQNPILIADHSEPQPDLTIVRFRTDYYRKTLPTPSDVLLLIEVADSSLLADRRVKVPLYAKAGIPEVWVIDLTAKSIEVLRDPIDSQYRTSYNFKAPQSIAPATFPDYFLKLAELFPD